MEQHQDLPVFRELLVFLAAAVAVVPLFQRLRASPVLGYLTVGILVGPHGLGSLADTYPLVAYVTIADVEHAKAFGELGIIFLLFVIGLGLSIGRLWTMRQLVFGLGLAQVLVCGAAIALVALAWGNDPSVTILLGTCLAMSSTAVVMQLLSERGELNTRQGRAAVAVLLFQDLAVVPALFLVSVLGGGDDRPVLFEMALALGRAAIAVGLILAVGRWLLRPLFRRIAALRSQELFVALSLLVALGTAGATALAGLSAALGAFLAGLVLSETEYRHQIEAEISPFKGLLVGLFFVTVGMVIDLRVIVDQALMVALAVLGLYTLKAVLIAGLARLFRQPWHIAAPLGLTLGQGGEFGFLIVGLAIANGVMPDPLGKFMILVVAVTMAATPLAAAAARRLGAELRRREQLDEMAGSDAVLAELEGHVVIAGMGRVGGTVAHALEARNIPFAAVDLDAGEVERQRRSGRMVFYGDVSRPEFLRRLGVDRASALVVAIDDPDVVRRLIAAARKHCPDLKIFARGRDRLQAQALMAMGVVDVVPEAVEGSLQLAGRVLEGVGVPTADADEQLARLRAEEMKILRGARKGPEGRGS